MAPYRLRKIWIKTPSATIGCQDYIYENKEDDLGRNTTTKFARHFSNVLNKIDITNNEQIQITIGLISTSQKRQTLDQMWKLEPSSV